MIWSVFVFHFCWFPTFSVRYLSSFSMSSSFVAQLVTKRQTTSLLLFFYYPADYKSTPLITHCQTR